jgi:hypothetical protein
LWVRTNALGALKHLAEYNLGALERAGYTFQKFTIVEVDQWSDSQLIDHLEAVLVIGTALLTPNLEGTSWEDENTITLTSGVLVVNEDLRDIRRKIIDILQRLFNVCQAFRDRDRILEALQTALIPSHWGTTPEMDGLVTENATTIIDFFIRLASTPGMDGMLLESIEQQLRWLRQIGVERLPNLETLESLLSSNEEYQIFRTLVGYGGRLQTDFDFKQDRLERSKRVEQFAEKITPETAPIWRYRFLAILKNYDRSDSGKYSYMHALLTKFGQRNPDLALAFLREKETELNPVVLYLISGIWSSRRELARELILAWVNEGKYLPECASLFIHVQEVDERLFALLFEKAAQANDCRALNNLVDSLARNYGRFRNPSDVLVQIIRELTKHRDTGWIHFLWFAKESPLLSLAEADHNAILENLVWLPHIDHSAEAILRQVAERFPLNVVEFFHARIGIQLQRYKDDRPYSYDAIPFRLWELGEPLKCHEEIVIPAVLEWYGEGGINHGWLYRLEASHFLNIIFPGFSPALERHVIRLIEYGGIEAMEDVFYLLRSYKGESFLWQICKAIIRKFDSDEAYPEIESKLIACLSQTGVVTGEYGFMEAYERKREDLKSWPDDGDLKSRQFLKHYDAFLERRALSEKQRADTEIRLRKMRFVQ